MLSLLRNDSHLLSPSRNPDQMPKTLYPSTMLMGRADRWAGMPERINAFATSEIVVGIVSVREIYQTTERTLAKLLGSIMCDARCRQDSWLWMIIFFYCVSYCCFFRFFFFSFSTAESTGRSRCLSLIIIIFHHIFIWNWWLWNCVCCNIHKVQCARHGKVCSFNFYAAVVVVCTRNHYTCIICTYIWDFCTTTLTHIHGLKCFEGRQGARTKDDMHVFTSSTANRDDADDDDDDGGTGTQNLLFSYINIYIYIAGPGCAVIWIQKYRSAVLFTYIHVAAGWACSGKVYELENEIRIACVGVR